jgi:hypothetical protein
MAMRILAGARVARDDRVAGVRDSLPTTELPPMTMLPPMTSDDTFFFLFNHTRI